jgi:hypothetical protein
VHQRAQRSTDGGLSEVKTESHVPQSEDANQVIRSYCKEVASTPRTEAHLLQVVDSVEAMLTGASITECVQYRVQYPRSLPS